MGGDQRSRLKKTLFVLVAVLIASSAVAMYYARVQRSAPAGAGEADTVTETAVREGAWRMPSMEGIRELLDSLRQAVAPEETSDLLREEAAAAEAEAVLKHLITLDPKKDGNEIRVALTEIRRIGYPAIKPLAVMLKSYRAEMHVLLLLEALAQVTGAEVERPLEALMTSHPSKAVRDKARGLYAGRATPEGRQRFLSDSIRALESPAGGATRQERAYVIDYLASSGAPEALDKLKEIAVGDPDDALRQQAVMAIGSTAGGEEFLLNLLVNEPSLRRAAASALGKSRSETVAEAAIALIEVSDDKAVRLAAIDILGGNRGQKAAEYVLRLLKGPQDEDVMRAAGAAAGMIATPGMALSLIEVLKEAEDRQQRRAIVSALAKMGPEAVPLLSGAVIENPGTVRADAIRALSQMRNEQAFDALKKMLEEWRVADDPEAQNELLMGIRVYDKADVVPALERIATEAAAESTRRTALETAADIKKADAMPFVLRVYRQDASESVRRGALRVMRRYGDRYTAVALRYDILFGEDEVLREEIEKTIEEIEKRVIGDY